MLILSRKAKEKLILTLPDGTVITIIVTKVKGGNVSIGIDAPAIIQIKRTAIGESK